MINMKVFYVRVEDEWTVYDSLCKDLPAVTASLHALITEYEKYEQEKLDYIYISSKYRDIHNWISTELPIELNETGCAELSFFNFDICVQAFNSIAEAEDDAIGSARAIIRGEENE